MFILIEVTNLNPCWLGHACKHSCMRVVRKGGEAVPPSFPYYITCSTTAFGV